MTAPEPELSFDRATYATGPAAPPVAACAMCHEPLGAEYWQWQKQVICGTCRVKVETALARSQSPQSIARAALWGGGTALACGAAYGLVMVLWELPQAALITIGIGMLVGRVVRKASNGVGGLPFQVIAAVCTYLASSMGYLHPQVVDVQSAGELLSILLFTVTLPIRAVTIAPIGALIVAFGVFQAWSATRGVSVSVDGPYRVASAGSAPAST
jgi:hypothetical protein